MPAASHSAAHRQLSPEAELLLRARSLAQPSASERARHAAPHRAPDPPPPHQQLQQRAANLAAARGQPQSAAARRPAHTENELPHHALWQRATRVVSTITADLPKADKPAPAKSKPQNDPSCTPEAKLMLRVAEWVRRGTEENQRALMKSPQREFPPSPEQLLWMRASRAATARVGPADESPHSPSPTHNALGRGLSPQHAIGGAKMAAKDPMHIPWRQLLQRASSAALDSNDNCRNTQTSKPGWRPWPPG